jgi:hypothetical protein
MSESSNYSLEESPTRDGSREVLVLPDWIGQVARPARGNKDFWLAYCRSNLAKVRAAPGYAERRREHGIGVEFVLS